VGSCGTCKCQLIDGKIQAQLDFGYVLDMSEIQDGYILACQSILKSDIQVSVNLTK
jgi:ferredoxin